MPAVLSIVSDRVKSSQLRLSASIPSSLIFPFHLRAGIRLHSLIRALEPSSLAAQDSVQSHTRSRRPGSRRTKPAKTHYTTSFIKSHTNYHSRDGSNLKMMDTIRNLERFPRTLKVRNLLRIRISDMCARGRDTVC